MLGQMPSKRVPVIKGKNQGMLLCLNLNAFQDIVLHKKPQAFELFVFEHQKLRMN